MKPDTHIVLSTWAKKFPLLLPGVISLLTGCGTMDVPTLKTQSAETYTQHIEKDGVILAVHPLTEAREIKEAFRVDLRKQGLLPILLVAENRSALSSFILAKDKVQVFNDATGITNTSHQNQVASGTGGRAALAVGMVGLSLPLVIAGLKMASDATVIQHNLADKELYSRTLAPGQKAQGFIYFQYPKGIPPAGAYQIAVELKNSASGDTIPFQFNVNLDPPKP